VFGAEAALVRVGFVSGTHALTAALFAPVRTGDVLCRRPARPTTRCSASSASRGTIAARSKISASAIAGGASGRTAEAGYGGDLKARLGRARGGRLRPALARLFGPPRADVQRSG
jgi:hypothetical protein